MTPYAADQPLDFNTRPNTDTISDASHFEARPCGACLVPALNTAALLAELGLPAHAVRPNNEAS